jgi:hypothetical protein
MTQTEILVIIKSLHFRDSFQSNGLSPFLFGFNVFWALKAQASLQDREAKNGTNQVE